MSTESEKQSGRERIAAAFSKVEGGQNAALMPYFTIGYPNLETSIEVIESIAEHSDLLELGIPFSDPIADGPTVQRSTQIALEQGTTTRKCLAAVKQMREKGMDTPAMLMGYYNPILAYGQEQFVADAAAAGVDGFIVPDLPPEEADELDTLARQHGLVLVHFLAPTSHARRIEMVTEKAEGFIYMVSVTGITGARSKLATGLGDFIGRVRAQTKTPLAVGFGIGTPQQAGEVGEIADGVIVGSALINTVRDAAPGQESAAAAAFVKSLQEGLIGE